MVIKPQRDRETHFEDPQVHFLKKLNFITSQILTRDRISFQSEKFSPLKKMKEVSSITGEGNEKPPLETIFTREITMKGYSTV